MDHALKITCKPNAHMSWRRRTVMLKDQGNSGGKLASRFYAVLKQEPFYNQDSLIFLILTQGYIIDFREREKGMGRERER